LECGRQLDRQIAGRGPFQDAVDVAGRAPEQMMVVRRVRNETALLNAVAVWIHCWEPDLRHERGDTREMSAKERGSQHHCRVRAVAADRLEGVLEVFRLVYLQRVQCDAERGGRRLHVL